MADDATHAIGAQQGEILILVEFSGFNTVDYRWGVILIIENLFVMFNP